MATFQPPPTYAEVILVDPKGREPPRFNPIWLKWFLDLVKGLGTGGAGGGTVTSVGLALSVNQGITKSESVSNPTTTPVINISLGLGAISPTSVASSGAVSGTAFSGSSFTSTGAVSGTTFSGTAFSGSSFAATAGISAGTTIVAGTNITSTAGNIVATAGNITATAGNVTAGAALSGQTVKATQAAGYISSDGSTGFTGTVTSASLVGKTITIKDGLITAFA